MRISDNKIKRVMKFLDFWEREVVEHLYGFNGKEKMSKRQVSLLFKLSKNELLFLENKIEGLIRNDLFDYQYVFIDDKMSKLIDTMSSAFFDMFKGIDAIKVEDSLKILPKQSRDIVILFYGLDGVHCADYDEVAQKYNITIDDVDKILELSINKIRKHFEVKEDKHRENYKSSYSRVKNNRYKMLEEKYGKERVEEALSLLNEKQQIAINVYYKSEQNLSVKDIEKQAGVSYSTIYTKANRAIDKIIEIIENPYLAKNIQRGYIEKSNKFGAKKINKYKMLEEKYGKEKVEEAFSLLSESQRNVLNLYYKSEQNLSIGEIAKKIGILKQNVYPIVVRGINKIVDIIEDPEFKNKNEGNLKDNIDYVRKVQLLIAKYGKDTVKKAMNELTDSEKKFSIKYYNLGNSKKHTLYMIAKKMGISVIQLNEMGEVILDKLEKILFSKREEKVHERKKEFMLVIKNKDTVKEVLNTLNEDEIKLIDLYYGFNGKVAMDINELSEKFNLDEEEIKENIKNIISKINQYTPFKK